MSELRFPVPRTGRVEWIGTAAEKRGPVLARDAVRASVEEGLDGEHHSGGPDRRRQVTLVQAEHLAAVGALLGRGPVEPAPLRRNIVVSGINLYALRETRLRVGSVLLECTGTCPPCGRMEENLGPGGHHAMRGHGGVTARVVEDGELRVGDAVSLEEVSVP